MIFFLSLILFVAQLNRSPVIKLETTILYQNIKRWTCQGRTPPDKETEALGGWPGLRLSLRPVDLLSLATLRILSSCVLGPLPLLLPALHPAAGVCLFLLSQTQDTLSGQLEACSGDPVTQTSPPFCPASMSDPGTYRVVHTTEGSLLPASQPHEGCLLPQHPDVRELLFLTPLPTSLTSPF